MTILDIYKGFIVSQYNYFFPKIEEKEPTKLGEIKYNEVIQVLNQLTPTNYVSDNKFSTTSKDEAYVYVKQSEVDTRKWIEENHDCDNFSFALQGYWSKGLYSFPFGIAWSSNHAFNVFIDNDKNIWIVEPQNSNFYTIEEAKKITGLSYWPIRMVII